MAYSDNFPATRPVFQADFANGGRIDPRATFSRSDSPIDATKAAASAVHYWSNEKHLSSENLLTDSNGFPAYATSNVVTPSASGTFIDGTDAFVVTETTANGYHFINSTSGQITSGTSYTSTVFVKAGTASSMQLAYNANVFGTGVYANYDLATPTNAPVAGADSTATSTGLSDGWVKITLTGTATGSGSYPLLYVICNDDDVNSVRFPTYTPASAKDFYVWEANVSTTGEKVLNQTSGQIHREYAPTLKSVATAGAARFEYDPATDGQSAGTSLGILVEGQSTNLITYSNNFSAWSGFQVTAEAGAAVGPDGQSCYVMREDSTAASNHYLSLGASGQSTSTTYTMSVYAKKVASSNQTRHLRLRVNGLGGQASVEYDLGNGTVNRTYGSSLNSQSISSIGNGWYRLVMTYTNGSGSVASGMIITGSPDTTANLPSYDGDGFSAFALFGAQVEEGSFASSLVSTSGSTATRAADSLSVATADIGYTGGPVSMQVDFKANSVIGETHRIAAIQNTRGLLTPYVSGGGDVKTFGDTDGTTAIDTSIKTDITANTDYSMALRWDTNDYRGALNGTLGNADTSCPLPDFDGATLYVGGQAASGVELDGHCKRIAVWGEALSDSNLQAITS